MIPFNGKGFLRAIIVSGATLLASTMAGAQTVSDFSNDYLVPLSERNSVVQLTLDNFERYGVKVNSAGIQNPPAGIKPATATPAVPTAPEKINSGSADLPSQKNASKKLPNVTKDSVNKNTGSKKKTVNRNRLIQVELGLQASSYRYQTRRDYPYGYSSSWDSNQVTNKGFLGGIFGSYTQRFAVNKPIKSLKDFGANPIINMARAEGDISWGQMNYDSWLTGKEGGHNISKINARILLGYDLPNDDYSLVVTPYFGFGYRRLYDKNSGGWDGEWTDSYRKFGRLTQYYYVPVGVETVKHLDEKWDIAFKVEGDVLTSGSIDKRYADIGGVYGMTNVNTGAPIQVTPAKTTHGFSLGYGLKTSLKVIRKYETLNFFAEPFLEYWQIARSSQDPYHSFAAGSTTPGDWYSVNRDDYEQGNSTVELGMRMGVQF